MKWIKLDGKKEPAFNKRVLIMNDKGEWTDGTLSEITHKSNGKEYIFDSGTEGHQFNDITHYMEIELPKEIENKNPTTKAGL